jgi:hypothetical protein
MVNVTGRFAPVVIFLRGPEFPGAPPAVSKTFQNVALVLEAGPS